MLACCARLLRLWRHPRCARLEKHEKVRQTLIGDELRMLSMSRWFMREQGGWGERTRHRTTDDGANAPGGSLILSWPQSERSLGHPDSIQIRTFGTRSHQTHAQIPVFRRVPQAGRRLLSAPRKRPRFGSLRAFWLRPGLRADSSGRAAHSQWSHRQCRSRAFD